MKRIYFKRFSGGGFTLTNLFTVFDWYFFAFFVFVVLVSVLMAYLFVGFLAFLFVTSFTLKIRILIFVFLK